MFSYLKLPNKPQLVGRACSLYPWKAEAGRLMEVRGQPRLWGINKTKQKTHGSKFFVDSFSLIGFRHFFEVL